MCGFSRRFFHTDLTDFVLLFADEDGNLFMKEEYQLPLRPITREQWQKKMDEARKDWNDLEKGVADGSIFKEEHSIVDIGFLKFDKYGSYYRLHEVCLVEIHRYPAGSCLDPYVVSGKNACPPDDVGGVYGYKQLLDILANPEENEEDYNSYKEWLPTGFDEHLFNVRDAELRMGDYLRAVRTVQQMMGDGYV